VVNNVIVSGLGRWRLIKGLDSGRERWHRGSEEYSMMARKLQGGLNNDTGSVEVDDGTGSREILAD
jgi:hypothetical protein